MVGIATAASKVRWEEDIYVPEIFNMAALLLDRHLEEGRGQRPAIFYGDAAITYEDLVRMANQAGNALVCLRVEMEQRVMILLQDCPEFIASYLGAMKMGAVPVPVNTLATSDDYRYYLNDSRASALVVSDELLPKIQAIEKDLRYLRHILVVGQTPPGYHSYADLTTSASPSMEVAPTSRDDPSYWLYSSGTTGQPKGVVHLHHDMVYCTATYVRHVARLTERDVNFSASKLFFSYGLVNSLYLPLLAGGAVVLFPGRSDPLAVLEVIQRYRPTLFFAVPTLYAAILRALEEQGSSPDLSSLRLGVSAGEALPAPIYQRWVQRTGVELLDGVGSTEFGYIFISGFPGRVKAGASGELLPGYGARIVDEGGQEVPDGEVGDLWVSSDSVAAYYWNKHERTKETFVGEWLRTGDKYVRHPDGYYCYSGRADDMLKVGGIWVSPMEVEAALLEHQAVAECAVVGAPDQDGLVKPKAFVILKSGWRPSAQTAQELQDHVKSRLAPYKYPRWIEFSTELPKTATGKIQRFRLRR